MRIFGDVQVSNIKREYSNEIFEYLPNKKNLDLEYEVLSNLLNIWSKYMQQIFRIDRISKIETK